MESYLYELKLEFDFKPEDLIDYLHKVLNQTDVEVISIKFEEKKRAGRPPKPNPRIDAWLQKRTKPFSCKTFAEYLGMPYASTYQKLQRMAARREVKILPRQRGIVMYEVDHHINEL